jgi:hypothetical protein
MTSNRTFLLSIVDLFCAWDAEVKMAMVDSSVSKSIDPFTDSDFSVAFFSGIVWGLGAWGVITCLAFLVTVMRYRNSPNSSLPSAPP